MHSPAIAKNVIAVGTTEDGTSNASNAAPPDWIHADDVDLVSTLNQCDLPEDNRTKPDINAPGEYITAPTLNNDYETWRGTSMSTPHVSGLLALYFDAANTTRRADLMKALLLNSAAGLGTKTGNGSAHQGFGRIQAMDFLYKLTNETVDTFLTGEVGEPLFGHPEEQFFTVDVPSGAEFLVVTMTYLDRAGSTSSSAAMVNNLDLRIEPPSGTPTYVDPDRDVDTVEKMWFSDPASGTWTIKIRSEDIPGVTHNSQSYAVSARVVTEGPSLTNGYPSSVNVVQGTPFNINLTQTADDWFVYGAYMIAESNHADIDLDSGSESGVVGGDLLGMYDEAYSWSPTFVATACGNFSNAIKVTMGATNFTSATYYVDVNVQCPCDKPGTPTLSTPASGGSTNDSTPFFDWSTASHATEYQIMVDNTPWDSPEINTTTSVSSYTSGVFLSDDWYNWAVRGHNTSGSCDVWGDWSTVWGFWVDTAAPLAPTLYSPANGSTTSDSTPSFDWSAPSGSVEYRIQIDNDANFSSPAINVLVSSSNFTPGSNLSDDTYYWKVQGRDDAGNWSSWSSTWSVTIETGVVGPLAYHSHMIDDDSSGASVGDGDGIVDCGESIELNITLGNQGSSTATGVNATLSTSDSYVTNISDDYENFPDIPGGGTGEDVYDYDFTVDGSTPDGHIIQFDLDINASLGGPWADSFDVTVSCDVNNPPYVPNSPSPSDGATGVSVDADLSWLGGDPDSDSVTYDVYLNANNPSPTQLVCNDVGTPNCALGTLSNHVQYYWYVVASDGQETTAGPVWDFTTEAAPQVGPLVYDSQLIDDDTTGQSAGNGNGVVNCGESIELFVDLFNQGTTTAEGIDVTISTTDPYVTWLGYNMNSGYPNIAGGGTATNTNDWDFSVASSVPNGHNIQFDLDITLSNGGPFSDSFNVPVTCQNGLAPPADFDGDGDTDVSVYRPNNGRWYIMGQGNFPWGLTGDLPVPGDYDGDGTIDAAVFRPSNGKWYIKDQGPQSWGYQDDVPLPCDYDGDGTDELAVYRPANGRWYIMGQGNFPWGRAGDIPVPADYDGDGSCDIAIFRPSNGKWYIMDQGPQSWGQTDDIPIPGDYDGDGTDELAVYRPSNGRWYIMGMSAQPWGQTGDVPVPGDYDGDGAFELAVLRPSNGKWYIQDVDSYTWYYTGDFPLPVRDTNGDGDVYD
jgi:hypothetical protein